MIPPLTLLTIAGWIPLMTPFGLADASISTLDFPTVSRTVKISARKMAKNILAGKI